jgi:hypothetical protein
MSSLNNNFINKTFNSLLKLFNNESFTGTTTHTISDGLGNTLPVSFSPNTTQFTGTVYGNTIVGGTNNNSSGTDSGILGGRNNQTSGSCSIIGGGRNNTTEGSYSAILGGQNNYTKANNSFIIGSNITATTENTLYVENISIKGNILDFTSNSGTTGQILTKGSNGLEWSNINILLTGNNVSVETFVVYTANTNTLIGTKLNITDFNTYSSNTNTLIGTKLNITDFNTYSSNTNTLIGTKFNKSGGTISGSVNVVGDVSGNTFYGIVGNTILGVATDGSYDTGLLGLTSASTINYTVDQIDTILALLAPAKPPRLDASSWISPGYSSAVASGDWDNISGTTLNKVIFNNLLPQFRVTGGTSGTFSGFWNGLLGDITFYVNSVSNGTKTLTAGSVNASTANTGTYLGLTLNVNDYYLNQTGKSGFWSAIAASGKTQNSLSNIVFTSQTYTLTHSNTGSVSETFYVDNTSTPTISNISQTSTPSITRYVSGVPSLAVNDSFTYSYIVNSAVSKFYTTGTFAMMNGSTWTTNNTTYASSSLSPKPFSGQSVTLTSQSLAATTNKYSESPSITFYGYNAINGVGTSSSSLTGYRIDTVSNENRLRNAANGENPTFFPITYTLPYTSSDRIVSNPTGDSYNYELQLLNGSYQLPSGNYTSFIGGYDYSSPGSQTRFVLLTGSPISSVNSVTISFNGVSGTWNAAPNGVTSGLFLNVRVGGIGWIDGNAAYPGSGSPSANGDPAMVAAPASTATSKQITFGSTARSGTIYVRIGLPAGSDKKFTGITIS